MEQSELPIVGRRYIVRFEDCCVAAVFEAVLLSLEAEPDEDGAWTLWGAGSRWDNGVTFSHMGNVELEHVPCESD